MKRLLVIQEHNADVAGLHWDIRFEDYYHTPTDHPKVLGMPIQILRSWVIPKHRFPEVGEKLLAIHVEDHPWSYRDFDGIIEEGYGAGTVKLVFSDYVEVSSHRLIEDGKFTFTHDNKHYHMFRMKGQQKKWLITQVE